MATSAQESNCPCGLSADYEHCCGRYVERGQIAPTAEALMRSRYSAFVHERAEYLLASWHPDTRPSRVRFNSEQRWLGLRIKAAEAGSENDERGVVEFVARYKVAGKGFRLHERSRFESIDGAWLYRDGDHL